MPGSPAMCVPQVARELGNDAAVMGSILFFFFFNFPLLLLFCLVFEFWLIFHISFLTFSFSLYL